MSEETSSSQLQKKELSVAERLAGPQEMSTLSRLFTIFVAPEDVFDDVRRWPRDWWAPLLVLSILLSGTVFFVQQRLELTPESLARAAIDVHLDRQGKVRKDLSQPEREALEQQEKIQTMVEKAMPLLFAVIMVISVGIGAGFYRLVALILQIETTFFRLVSVLSYSYYAPTVVKSVISIIVAMLRKPGDVDAETYILTRDIVAAGPAAFVSNSEHPVLRAFLANLDLFNIWVSVLVVIGLVAVSRKLKMSKAIMIVGGVYLFWMIVSSLGAAAMS